MTATSGFTYEKLVGAVEYVKSQVKDFKPKFGIICGSGLGNLVRSIDARGLPTVELSDLPHFSHLKSSVEGHSSKLHFGYIQNVAVIIAEGRLHPYEGYSYLECCLPIFLMRKLGVERVILTNAAGSVNPAFKVGAFVLIKNHVDLASLCGLNPLFGVRDSRFWSNDFGPGSRFINTANCYDEDFRVAAKSVATNVLKLGDGEICEGIYCRTAGPYYETMMELQMLKKSFSADVIGMSTTYEACIAHQCSMKVLGITVVTDSIDGIGTLTHEEVLQASNKAAASLASLISKLIELHIANI